MRVCLAVGGLKGMCGGPFSGSCGFKQCAKAAWTTSRALGAGRGEARITEGVDPPFLSVWRGLEAGRVCRPARRPGPPPSSVFYRV